MTSTADWLVPLLIFTARIFDVSIGTVRMIMVISGHRVASVGTLVGMTIEQRIAVGYRVVRVINPRLGLDLAGALRTLGYTATRLDGHDRDGPVEIVFVPVRRKSVPRLLERIAGVTPDAFFSVERAERVSGLVPPLAQRSERFPWGRFGQLRK